MEILLTALIVLIAGGICGYMAVKSRGELEWRDKRIGELEKEAEEVKTSRDEVVRLGAEVQSRRRDAERLEREIRDGKGRENGLNNEVTSLEKRVVELRTTLDNERNERRKFNESVEKTEERFKTAFENLGNRIFEGNSEKFQELSKERLENFLGPLKKDIKEFKDEFAKTDKGFAGQFGELKSQIEQLGKLNRNIGAEAQNLTRALRGDSKHQGNWGEFILEKALEMCGLQEGVEYEMQKNFSDEDGKKRRPDVVVHLPEGKDVVIDSKVSLKDYENYCSSDSENEKADFLKRHLDSVERHIKDLGEKDYQNLPGVRTFNFVLMFIAVEPAYILAVSEKRDLFQRALDKHVVLVCPSTLLAVLKTVHSLWQMDKQNANAREIAEQAGKIYDKFAGFVDKMETVGRQLKTAGNSFDDAYKSLSEGRGNLVGRAEKLKQLGAKTSKSLPANLVEESGNGDDRETEEAVAGPS